MLRMLAAALAAPSFAVPLAAQASLVFAMAEPERTLDGAGGNVRAAELRTSELAGVLPSPTLASARPFLTDDAQWAWLGDFDADGQFVDDGTRAPGGAIDAVFVARYGALAGATGPREVFVSRVGTDDLGPSARDGDVFRYSTQGSPLVFLNEIDLAAAIPGVSDFDLDALAQSPAGDLFFSVSDASLGAVGTDGSILFVAAADVLYGPGDIVLGFTANSAVQIASEADVIGWITASGVASVDGSPPGTFDVDLSALELDPNGGTWTSAQDGQTYPNLWFGWDSSDSDGAVLSTAGGGSVAVFGVAPLASTTATYGTALGLLPGLGGVSGLAGLAVLDANVPPLTLENYPTSRFASTALLFTRQEVAGATSGGAVFFFWDNVSNAPGSVATVVPLPPPFVGELLGDGSVQILGAAFADGNGHARFESVLPSIVLGSNLHVIQQAYDLGTARFATPAPMDF